MNPPSLDELQAFACVARLRSFRKAGLELGVTPSALSHALKQLEQRLGLRLLHRTTRSVAPTEAGERLLARLAPALAEVHAALEEVNAFRQSPMGTLRINAPTAACELVLAPLVARFLASHPGMRVDLMADDAFIDIVTSGYDAGVRFGESLQQDMVAVPIGEAQRFAVVASPAYLQRMGRPRTPRELSAHEAIRIRFPSGQVYRWEFEKARQKLEIEVEGPLALNNMHAIVQAAEAGLGLAYVYRAYAAPALQAGRLQAVLEDWTMAAAHFHLYYPSHRHVPAGLKAFIQLARAVR